MNCRLSSASCPLIVLTVVCGLLTLVGCSQQTSSRSVSGQPNSSSGPKIDASGFVLSAEPEGAADVINVRENAGDGDEIVIVGRIGGSENPWVEGRAAFAIVDGSLKACSDIEGDDCPIPWDYCCETSKLPTATALVKVVDEKGDLVKTDARGLLNVKELSTVVVKGKAKRDESGNLTVLARGVFVRTK